MKRACLCFAFLWIWLVDWQLSISIKKCSMVDYGFSKISSHVHNDDANVPTLTTITHMA
jgi:hypothetical protein